MKKSKIVLAFVLFSAFSVTALAGPRESATDHIHAIAAGEVGKVMHSYGKHVVFQWVGGPLDGVYTNHHAIETVWKKFAKGNAPLKAEISQLTESANPKGATVTANVVFSGKKTIKVRYVLVYRDGKLVDEIWQIDPKLGSAY